MSNISHIQGKLHLEPVTLTHFSFRSTTPIYVIFLHHHTAVKTKSISKSNQVTYQWDQSRPPIALEVDNISNPCLEVVLLGCPDRNSLTQLPNVLGRSNLNLAAVLNDPKLIDKSHRIDFGNGGVLECYLTLKRSAPLIPPKPYKSIKEQQQQQQDQQQTQMDPMEQQRMPKVDPSVLQKVYDDKISDKERKKHFKRLRKVGTAIKRSHSDWKSSLHLEHNDDKSILDVELTSPSEPNSLQIPRLSVSSSLSEQESNHSSHPSSPRSSQSQSSFSPEISPYTETFSAPIPYSASTIGIETEFLPSTPLPSQQRANPPQPSIQKISPELYRLQTNLREGRLDPSYFAQLIDPGLSEYKGEGQWNKDRLRDSHIRMNEGNMPPRLPPKIPKGLTKKEFYVLRKEEFIGYFEDTVMPDLKFE